MPQLRNRLPSFRDVVVIPLFLGLKMAMFIASRSQLNQNVPNACAISFLAFEEHPSAVPKDYVSV